ncbi:MAG: twin transmembrane helix small protein [Acidimicrobiales bacterium]
MAGDDKTTPVQKAESWLDEKTKPDVDRPKGLQDASADPTVAELRREQRQEIENVTFGTEGQTRGALFGSLAFAAVGLVLGALIGFLLFDGDSPGRTVVPVMVALFAGVMGFVYWGGRVPELENETMSTTGAPGSSSTPRDPGNDDRGR